MTTASQVATLLKREIAMVVGCTEPACCAFVFRALVREWPGKLDLQKVRARICLSRDVHRNASTAVIPFLDCRGVRAAVAAGLTTSATGFNVFPAMDVAAARKLLRRRNWLRVVVENCRGLYVRAELTQDGHRATALITKRHDRIERMTLDGRRVPLRHSPVVAPPPLRDIVRLAAQREARLEALARRFLLKQARGEERIKNIEDRVNKLVRERMLGYRHAIMTITGSGNQGIFLALPLRDLYERHGRDVLPAVVVALLVQPRLSYERHRISDACGLAIKAAPALAAGLAYAHGASVPMLRRIMADVTRDLRRVTCRGARPSCGTKAAKALRTAFAHASRPPGSDRKYSLSVGG